MLKQIYHKKNELFEVKFYEDKECTKAFDFTNAKDLYIELKDGDISPLLELCAIAEDSNIYTQFVPKTQYYTLSAISFILSENKNILYMTYETNKFTDGDAYNSILENIKTITPNLSKYIPEDNAVLFLDEWDMEKHKNSFLLHNKGWHPTKFDDGDFYVRAVLSGNRLYNPNKLTIFLSHGTQATLKRANEVAKELKAKFGVEEVNLYVKDCFIGLIIGINGLCYTYKVSDEISAMHEYYYINKIITTNLTGILEPQNSERLQVIDCKEIFEEYLKENN